MQKEYDHKKIEGKWQKEWEKNGIYNAINPKNSSDVESNPELKKHCYVLDMFPYPSGQGLHVGHPRGYIASDIYARFKRMQGYNVLHPMGYDAFGLPAEQYAIQNKIHPRQAVLDNVATFKKQLEIIGFSYDWSREINTTDPEYYRWTQWIFLQLYESWFNPETNKAEKIDLLIEKLVKTKEWQEMNEKQKQDELMKYRLAYEGYSEVNWCPELGTVLANDEIVNGADGHPVSERGGFPVEKKSMRQWFMRITAYADRLITGLEGLDWSSHIKEIQKNWIGKSVGSEIEFNINNIVGENDSDKNKNLEKIKVFTTRADTLFGVTYVVLAPEHELVKKILNDDSDFENVSNKKEIEKYIEEIKNNTDEDRTATNKDKTGVELNGIKAINPANGEEIPIWIADYVLASYGTGAVMAVPAHDDRDYVFAKKYNLPIKNVIAPRRIDYKNPHVEGKEVVFRKAVIVIIKNPKSDEYLILKWKKQPWTTFVTGGIDGDETPEQATLREVKEETGYSNIKIIRRVVGPIQSEFFAKHKDVNRVAHTWTMLCELTPETVHEEITDEEKEIHEISWVSKKDLKAEMFNHSEIDLILKNLESGSAITEEGILVSSDGFNGLSSEEACAKITEAVGGRIVTKYKMRDAIFARQRYWGEPIPLKHNNDGVISALSEDKLPLELPDVKSYEPIGTGESPLAGVKSWVENGYETNTMPGWAGSSWYFLRYMDPTNNERLAGENAMQYWKQVDMYVGGAEHATGHLLYSRFWNKFLFDLGIAPTDEPFAKLRNQGMILGADNRKMSKRWGNVINPDDVVKMFGADTLRVYELFMGPFEQSLPWNTESIIGSRRFIERVWRLSEKVSKNDTENGENKISKEAETLLHKTIKKITEDIENFSFNTSVSALMILTNILEKEANIDRITYSIFLKLLAPAAPHVTEELWAEYNLGGDKNTSIHKSVWPTYDPKKLISETTNIVIQINGKMRATIEVKTDADQDEVMKIAKENENVLRWVGEGKPKKVIFVPGRLLNIVTENV